MKLDASITFRLAKAERALVAKAAKENDLPLGEWVREAVVYAAAQKLTVGKTVQTKKSKAAA